MARLSVARKVMVVWLGGERIAARSTRVAESGGDRDYEIFTNICEEVEKLAEGETALRRGLRDFIAENRFEKAVHV